MTPYKVKYKGKIIAQFQDTSLAVHFVNSLSGNDFTINYDNRTNVWNVGKEGAPVETIILNRVMKFNAESDARFNAKMLKFKKEREALFGA